MSVSPCRVSRFRSTIRLRRALGLGAALVWATPASAATWQNRVSYGGSTVMDLYVPDKVDASPGVVVSLHYCGGNSGNAHGWFQALADQHGFIIIAPSAGGNCFDASPTRSGERDAISKMVAYVIDQKQADETRVFAAGASSGACMTQALLAAYPEVFAAGAVLAGVPAGAWTGGNTYAWSTPDSRTAAEWGDIVRKAGPMGFAGPWPRVQLWHGTADSNLTYSQNFPSEVEQWTNVHGVTDANATKSSFKGSQDTWERSSYENGSGALVLETNVAQGAPHDLSGRGLWADVVRFFGLDQDAPPAGGGGTGGTGGTGGGGTATGGSGGASSAGTSSGGNGGGSGGSPGSAGARPTGGTGSGVGGPNPGQGGSGGQASGTAGAATNPGTSGSSSTPPSGNAGSNDDGGCSVSAAGRGGFGAIALAALGLGALLNRRRRAS